MLPFRNGLQVVNCKELNCCFEKAPPLCAEVEFSRSKRAHLANSLEYLNYTIWKKVKPIPFLWISPSSASTTSRRLRACLHSAWWRAHISFESLRSPTLPSHTSCARPYTSSLTTLQLSSQRAHTHFLEGVDLDSQVVLVCGRSSLPLFYYPAIAQNLLIHTPLVDT